MEFAVGRREGLRAHPHWASQPPRQRCRGEPAPPHRVCQPGVSAAALGPRERFPLAPRLPRCWSTVSPRASVLGSPVTWCHFPAAGSVSWEVH